MNDNKRTFQEMADFAPVGIAVIDAAGSARYANRRLAEITLRSREVLLGLDLKSVLIQEDRAHRPGKTVHDGRHYRCHTDVEAGARCTVEVVLSWMTDGDNHLTGAVAIIDDITEEAAAEHREPAGDRHQSAEAHQQVAKRVTRLDRMAAGIAHEFGHTLTSMLTADRGIEHGHAARSGMTGPATHPPPAGRDDIPAPTTFDVNDLIQATVPPIVERETAVTLSLRLSEPPATVHMDPARLEEALRLLTVNAMEAVARRGTITIMASRARNRPTALPDGEFVHISVMDNGHGMAAESLEHAIEPFYTTKAGASWAGLGLATTHGIVNQAGGRMYLVSTPDAGASVHVYLPSAVSVREGAPSGHDGARQSRGTLLIVDDNPDLRSLATQLLTNAGFEVLTATGGVDAMVLLRDRTFDCLVTDITMPDMGGIDLAESASAVDPHLPVVYVSGFVNIPWGVGGLLPVGAHSLTKPYSAETLTSAVRRAIRTPKSR